MTDAEPGDFPPPPDGVEVLRVSDAVEAGSEGSPAFPTTEIAESDPAVIFYTSGTTGRP